MLLLSQTNIQIPPLADIDLFHLLVSLCYTLPTLFASKEIPSSLNNVPTGNLNDLYLMRLIFMVHAIQILTSQGFLHEQSKISSIVDNDDHQQWKTKTKSTDDAELQMVQKLVERITKRQTYVDQSLLNVSDICDCLDHHRIHYYR